MAQPVVQDHRRERHALGDGRRGGEGHEGVLGAVDEVVGHADLVEPQRLDAAAVVQPAGGVGGQTG